MAEGATTSAALAADAVGSSQGRKKRRRKAAFKEVFANEPKIVGKTRRKQGAKAAQAQKVAIALSKAGISKPKRNRKSGTKNRHKRGGFIPGKTVF